VKSVCSIYPSATLAERELMEMFGIIIEDTPNKDRLLISDDWPAGVFPLRKDFHPEELPDKAEEK
jgi:Ni,Fe-hydrogenase III component G